MAGSVVAEVSRAALGLALAFNYVALPLAAGAVSGWLISRSRGRRIGEIWVFAAVVALPTLVSLGLPGSWLFAGVYDIWLMLSLMSVGFLATGHAVSARWGRKEAGALAVSLLVGAGLVEGGYRMLDTPAPGYMPLPSQDVQLFMQPTWLTECGGREETELPFPDLYLLPYQKRIPPQRERPHTILHVGDSMIWGNPSPDSMTSIGLLDATDVQASHINAGMPGTGPDYQYLLVSNWVRHAAVDAVVVHFTGTGDLMDMNQDHCFCGGGQIVDYAGGRPTLNCPKPLTTPNYAARFLLSPPPYLFRVLASSSLVAQALSALVRRAQLGVSGEGTGAESLEQVVMILGTLQEELARRNTRLVVVKVPDRWDLDASLQDPSHVPIEEVIVRRLRNAGLRVLDPQPALTQAIRRTPDAAWFRDDVPRDAHFGVAGHAFMAQWLLHELTFGWEGSAPDASGAD